ncbi:hypothetical protein [Methylobacterium sp.]|uniref:hypothetical protein n=1 Tax=Methylobacterium sp. TaxID=409 RepID=UPI0025ED66D9|nr:hypothetical protein [Methylobacterium sp.]MBY0259600.1 hypothetical protein [Methylobacterium sp.]
MANPFWPSDLPVPIGQVGSLGTDQLYDPPQETQFDDGPSRTRRRRLYDETPRKIVLRLTRPQFVTFRGFVRDTLNMGARRFSSQVRLPDGRLGMRTCRIVGAVAEQDLGPVSVVSFTLMVQGW